MKGKGKKENSTDVGSKTVFSVQNVISSTFDRKRDMSICREILWKNTGSGSRL